VSSTVRHIWGWVLVAIGLTGLIMPIMPGWIFLIPGLMILADYFAWARSLMEWAKKKAGMEHEGAPAARHVEEHDGDDPGRNRT
jgi:hypothetical protein